MRYAPDFRIRNLYVQRTECRFCSPGATMPTFGAVTGVQRTDSRLRSLGAKEPTFGSVTTATYSTCSEYSLRWLWALVGLLLNPAFFLKLRGHDIPAISSAQPRYGYKSTRERTLLLERHFHTEILAAAQYEY